MIYSKDSIDCIVEKQRTFFLTGKTLPVAFRIEQLKKLRNALLRNEDALEKALAADLSRSKVEAYLCDIGPTIMEINEMIAGLKKWARPETHFSGLINFPSLTTKVYKMPYGVTLVISPFNFPILLSFGVLAASVCGGNTVILKTSSKSPASTAITEKIIKETFDPAYITLIGGGHQEADWCLEAKPDKIFYTGSPKVAKHVLAKAAENLTPVALELGGETGNWCIVRRDANLKDAARKIAFFKLCNAGQVCININQVAVAREVADPFLKELKAEFTRQIGAHPEENPEYPRLITKTAYENCKNTVEAYRNRVIYGGQGNETSLKYAPTVLYPVDIEEEVVNRELFCPILPVVPFADAEIENLLSTVARRQHPLALYLFTRDIAWAKKTMQSMQYGGGCVNEVCVHMMAKGVPFNGVGHSGMGAYHGEWGFREFTHPSTVLYGKTLFNLPIREHPYIEPEKSKMAILHSLEK